MQFDVVYKHESYEYAGEGFYMLGFSRRCDL